MKQRAVLGAMFVRRLAPAAPRSIAAWVHCRCWPVRRRLPAQRVDPLAVFGLLALSFTFVWGHAGMFSFGQAAFFGIGGYAYGVAADQPL